MTSYRLAGPEDKLQAERVHLDKHRLARTLSIGHTTSFLVQVDNYKQARASGQAQASLWKLSDGLACGSY